MVLDMPDLLAEPQSERVPPLNDNAIDWIAKSLAYSLAESAKDRPQEFAEFLPLETQTQTLHWLACRWKWYTAALLTQMSSDEARRVAGASLKHFSEYYGAPISHQCLVRGEELYEIARLTEPVSVNRPFLMRLLLVFYITEVAGLDCNAGVLKTLLEMDVTQINAYLEGEGKLVVENTGDPANWVYFSCAMNGYWRAVVRSVEQAREQASAQTALPQSPEAPVCKLCATSFGLGIASLPCGVTLGLIPLSAVVLGIIGLAIYDSQQRRGKWMAVAGTTRFHLLDSKRSPLRSIMPLEECRNTARPGLRIS